MLNMYQRKAFKDTCAGKSISLLMAEKSKCCGLLIQSSGLNEKSIDNSAKTIHFNVDDERQWLHSVLSKN